MSMKVDSAIVTKKRENALFNTDSVNINGKVLPREIIQNGYKGAGSMSGVIHFTLAGSPVEGIADATAAALNSYSDALSDSNADPSEVINSFFERCDNVLQETNHEPNSLDIALIYMKGRTVRITRKGNISVFSYNNGTLTKPAFRKPINSSGSFEYSVFTDVTVDSTYILLSSGVTDVLSEKDIEDICRVAQGSVKRIVNLISRVAATKESDKSISAMAVKVTQTDATTASMNDAPATGFTPNFDKIESAEPATEINPLQQENTTEEIIEEVEPDTVVTDENIPDNETASDDKTIEIVFPDNVDNDGDNLLPDENEGRTGNKKTKIVLLGITSALSVILVVLIALIAKDLIPDFLPAFSNKEETTTETETTLPIVIPTEDETTTEEETTAKEKTTEKPTSARSSRPETTTRRKTTTASTTRSNTTRTTTNPPATSAAPITDAPTTAHENNSDTATSDSSGNSSHSTEGSTAEETQAKPETTSEEPGTVEENNEN